MVRPPSARPSFRTTSHTSSKKSTIHKSKPHDSPADPPSSHVHLSGSGRSSVPTPRPLRTKLGDLDVLGSSGGAGAWRRRCVRAAAGGEDAKEPDLDVAVGLCADDDLDIAALAPAQPGACPAAARLHRPVHEEESSARLLTRLGVMASALSSSEYEACASVQAHRRNRRDQRLHHLVKLITPSASPTLGSTSRPGSRHAFRGAPLEHRATCAPSPPPPRSPQARARAASQD